MRTLPNYKSVIRYIRNEFREPMGVVVALIKDGNVQVGVSFCSQKDMFCKKTGKAIAFSRALKEVPEGEVPKYIKHNKGNYDSLRYTVSKAVGDIYLKEHLPSWKEVAPKESLVPTFSVSFKVDNMANVYKTLFGWMQKTPQGE